MSAVFRFIWAYKWLYGMFVLAPSEQVPTPSLPSQAMGPSRSQWPRAAMPSKHTIQPLFQESIYNEKGPQNCEPSSIYGDLLEICKILLDICCWSNENLLELLLTGTCRDWMSADNVLLKTLESINTTADCSLAEYLCSLLE